MHEYIVEVTYISAAYPIVTAASQEEALLLAEAEVRKSGVAAKHSGLASRIMDEDDRIPPVRLAHGDIRRLADRLPGVRPDTGGGMVSGGRS